MGHKLRMKMLSDNVEPSPAYESPGSPTADAPPHDGHALLLPVATPFALPTPMYGAMLAIWHLRRSLQRRFPLHKGNARDYLRFLAWCMYQGRQEFAILRAIPQWDAALAQPIELPSLRGDRWAGCFSVAMLLYGVARYRYGVTPMLREITARHRIAAAYWRGERHRLQLGSPAPWQYAALADNFGDIEGVLKAIRETRSERGKTTDELVELYGLTDLARQLSGECVPVEDAPSGRVGEPAQSHLPVEARRLHVPLPLQVVRPLSLLGEGLRLLRPHPSECELSGVTSRVRESRSWSALHHYPFGVNLFGYARGEIGIGEDVRLVAQALDKNGIPFCIVNVKPSEGVSQRDASVEHWIVDRPRYAINIFCTTGFEQIRFACTHGLETFEGRYNIGFWPWELPNWPASCRHAFSMVDEIWGISRYTANAYRDSNRPVHVMSLPVEIDCVAELGRSDFGLPENDYLFVYSFDFNSTLARKNPVAVVEAFQRAFPRRSNDSVGLVLKASHVKRGNRQWRYIKRIAAADRRIHIVDRVLRKPQVLALYKCCDCYVSLHRAEGFGRSLAEALLLDLQLIATAFSGNLDFCSPERVGLVRYHCRGVDPGEYFFAHDQSWAEPDIEHAAELMREIREVPRPLEPREFDFSPAAVGSRYAARLNDIRSQLGVGSADNVSRTQ